MKKYKKRHLFFLFLSFVLLSSYFSSNTVHADGSVSTKGVIQLYSDTASDTSSSSTTVPDQSNEKPSFPSTGEVVLKGVIQIGIFVIVFVLFIFFLRKKREEKNKDEQ
ncbi:hypothetical protein BCR22_12430 [Enterococcus plantarum]|uniref:LPXTG cell wall anchor domain-containing protein n=2 Tax=Enterococcus plantarum TaxID=1077675 RepID=UPI00084DC669|nr:LPXTG cell wall anchor domain-containing protein [Enterococcus plantarum]OEG17775.1 hypothetical protein BCR22_12430 [Enterococcus plantarum]